MARGNQPDNGRARRTLYVSGFNPKLITKPLLFELFHQGGPVTDITLFETHAYVLFQHEESVPYCLALFNDIELFGLKLKISPRSRTVFTYAFVDHLASVRNKIRDDNLRIEPPNLPAKIYSHNNSCAANSSLDKTNSKTRKRKSKKSKNKTNNNNRKQSPNAKPNKVGMRGAHINKKITKETE